MTFCSYRNVLLLVAGLLIVTEVHGQDPGARGRDVLYAVSASAGRNARARPGLRHNAVHAARR